MDLESDSDGSRSRFFGVTKGLLEAPQRDSKVARTSWGNKMLVTRPLGEMTYNAD